MTNGLALAVLTSMVSKNKKDTETSDKEFIQVTSWEPTWEESKDTLPTLLERIQEFKTQKDEPDLSLPTSDPTFRQP